MKQAKKIFTRMLLNNWGGIAHQVICFHESVNLFSGKSGSGKSTVMDAMQVVLYGSIRNDFLNRAADDTKNKRSVLSYLRGAQKDGTANREHMDFGAQVVLELLDTSTGETVCIGASFEVAGSDQEVGRYWFFSHTGGFPADNYLSGGTVPYTYAVLKRLIEERSAQAKNMAGVNINRIYPTREAYLNALCDTIFGYLDAGRFKTMQKSAIALRMANGTAQFIKDYMFPRSKEDTVSAISDQLAAYREIKEQVETLENQIELLEEIRLHDEALWAAKKEQSDVQTALRVLDIEDKKAHLAAKKEEREDLAAALASCEAKIKELAGSLAEQRDAQAALKAELFGGDFGKKREQLAQGDDTAVKP